MKKRFLSVVAAALVSVSSAGVACEGVMFDGVFARETPPMASTGAVYFQVMNHGDTDAALVGAKSDVAKSVQIHTTINKDGTASMKHLKKVAVPKGESVKFQQGGRHVMLMGLKKELKAGDSFPLTLVFENGKEKTLDVPVRKLGADAPKGGHKHH